jgi:hypothetical protein
MTRNVSRRCNAAAVKSTSSQSYNQQGLMVRLDASQHALVTHHLAFWQHPKHAGLHPIAPPNPVVSSSFAAASICVSTLLVHRHTQNQETLKCSGTTVLLLLLPTCSSMSAATSVGTPRLDASSASTSDSCPARTSSAAGALPAGTRKQQQQQQRQTVHCGVACEPHTLIERALLQFCNVWNMCRGKHA